MTYGSGEYCYECVEGWGQPEDRKEIRFQKVAGLASDREDNIYVLTRTETPIYVMNKEGEVLDTFGTGVFGRAHGLHRSADGCIWGVDDMRHAVYRFSPEHRLTMTLGTPDHPSDTGYLGRDVPQNKVLREAGPFNRPTRMTSDSDGNLYISDGYGNARIHKFSSDGQWLKSWGKPGDGPGEFNLPHGIGIDRQNILYVADRQNNRVQLFDREGRYLDQWTDFYRPSDINIDKDGMIFVTECLRSNHFSCSPSRVTIVRPDGKIAARLFDPEQSYDSAYGHHCAHGMAIDSEGSIYIGNVGLRFPKGFTGLWKYRRV